MRHDEEFCQQVFDAYLQSKIPSEQVTWKEGNQQIPPDYYLMIEDETFVVEITTLMESVDGAKKKVPIQSIYESCKEFVKQVEASAIEKGILTGRYYVTFRHVLVNFYNVRANLKELILAYISETQSVPESKQKAITIDQIKYCVVQKTTGVGSEVKIGLYPSNAKWEGEARKEICELLQEIGTQKARKLAHLDFPKILIILYSFPYIDAQEIQHCISTFRNAHEFHTVFLVDPGSNSSFVLYSKNASWY